MHDLQKRGEGEKESYEVESIHINPRGKVSGLLVGSKCGVEAEGEAIFEKTGVKEVLVVPLELGGSLPPASEHAQKEII